MTEINVNYTLQDSSPAAAATAPIADVQGADRGRAGITNPVPIYRPQPDYSEEAKTAKWQGAVLLSVVVDEAGKPGNIKVVRPLGMGLDEKAIEAVSQWKFSPGTKDGVAVPVAAQIEVQFRLN
jgi:TonB family protein